MHPVSPATEGIYDEIYPISPATKAMYDEMDKDEFLLDKFLPPEEKDQGGRLEKCVGLLATKEHGKKTLDL